MAGLDGHFISSTSNSVLSLEITFWTDRDESGKEQALGAGESPEWRQAGGGKKEKGMDTFCEQHFVRSLGVDVADFSSGVTYVLWRFLLKQPRENESFLKTVIGFIQWCLSNSNKLNLSNPNYHLIIQLEGVLPVSLSFLIPPSGPLHSPSE